MASCTDNTLCAYMQFSNDNAIWSDAIAYSDSATWTLSTGNGEKTVYVRFIDEAGNSVEVSRTITLSRPATNGGGGGVGVSLLLMLLFVHSRFSFGLADKEWKLNNLCKWRSDLVRIRSF